MIVLIIKIDGFCEKYFGILFGETLENERRRGDERLYLI
jgi:hypothetical protein